MPFVLLLIGLVLIVAAFNNAQASLAAELEKDAPGFFRWGLAIAAILALGYVPALRTPSRALLAVVVFVLVVTNYQQIIAGIKSFAGSGSTPQGGSAASTSTSSSTSSGGLPVIGTLAGDAAQAGLDQAVSSFVSGVGPQ